MGKKKLEERKNKIGVEGIRLNKTCRPEDGSRGFRGGEQSK